jgi:hypothetical protein
LGRSTRQMRFAAPAMRRVSGAIRQPPFSPTLGSGNSSTSCGRML